MRRLANSFVLMLSLVGLGACRTKGDATAHASNTVSIGSPAGTSSPESSSPGTSPPDMAGVEYYTAAALAHMGDSLARGSTSGHMLRAHGGYQYLQIRRGKSGVPEVHDRWTDVTVVQSGRASLLSGGRVSGSRVETPGEHRGGTIAGGASRPVGPGDLMVIPAGIPHQYVIAPGDSLRYLTIKVLATPEAH
jgi:mannose-6-phosphate isomerase-like protein (cupin superfamily)